MYKYTGISTEKQRKISRIQVIEAAQKEWNNEAQELAQEKENLGYKHFPWDAFLEIDLDASIDITTQSKIIDLQTRYKELKERESVLWAEDRIIEEFNKKHAVVRVEQTYILTEKTDIFGRQDFSLESRLSFKNFYEDETIICIDSVERPKADVWLKSPKRRKYKGIIFDPRTTESPKDFYNLWKGFSKNPIKGDCLKYWSHIEKNICNDDKESYLYLRKWMACIFQYPDVVHTAIVLCGSQGVGKNSFVNPLGVLLGSHYVPLSNIAELITNFNSHLKNAVLIHANEALWGGNKKDIGTVKAMITEETCLIEGKGKDRIVVPNFKHVILSSNEDWPVHLDPDDRRFFVLRVAENHKEDHGYFKEVKDELENGGYEALLYDLLHEDLSNFDPRKLPTSSNSFSIKIRSCDSAHRYLYEVLCEGGFSVATLHDNEMPVWQPIIPKDAIYQDYISWCDQNKEVVQTKELFGRTIKKLIMAEDTRPGGGSRTRCYKLLSLRQTRLDFAKAFKEKPERIFDDFEDECDEQIQSILSSR
jgi:hypothetical protein